MKFGLQVEAHKKFPKKQGFSVRKKPKQMHKAKKAKLLTF
jgi:hypothetical protein